MARIIWDRPQDRRFESGIDRGVLYPRTGRGVAWNGLISVVEKPSGGEPKPYYIDGVKYMNESVAEEYAATISAFTYPDAFLRCEGLQVSDPGLYIGQQPKESFGLTYRTFVGDSLNGYDHGYKIHLVYNAMVAPSDKLRETLSEDPEATNFSWPITTTPIHISGFRRSAYLTIDSNKTQKQLLGIIEDRLYGSDGQNPYLPPPQELIDLFEIYQTSGYGVGPYGLTPYGDPL